MNRELLIIASKEKFTDLMYSSFCEALSLKLYSSVDSLVKEIYRCYKQKLGSKDKLEKLKDIKEIYLEYCILVSNINYNLNPEEFDDDSE